ncbi:YqiA/YcfP family alpha/beta fold hydrolase, partial [Psychrobacter urativorans]|uniref:YqiA/YcfP family alpha/beta fold hydrolase n=2 Tax=Psychrobacter TaxID=497 RepID=UPI003BB69AFF
YFATLVSNETGCPALLINPSTLPHITLQRFEADKSADTLKTDNDKDKVLHTTDGGWSITKADLQWFAHHQLLSVDNPSQVTVLLKKGDELLDANLSAAFYKHQGATVIMQAGGDHRFSDFKEHLPEVFEILKQL